MCDFVLSVQEHEAARLQACQFRKRLKHCLLKKQNNRIDNYKIYVNKRKNKHCCKKQSALNQK